MADLNPELEDSVQLLARLNEELRTLGYVTDQTARALGSGGTKSAKQLEQAGEKAVDALVDLAGSVLGAARAMNQGAKGAAAFNNSIDQAATGIIGLVTVLGLLVPLGRALKPLGGLLSALGVNVAKVNAGAIAATAGIAGAAMAAKGFTELMKAANEQADKLYKGYSDLARSGAAASDGMKGVFEDAKKLGIAVTELDGMVSVIAQNATELTLFGGGVVKGRQQLAAMGRSIEGSREYFLRLGYDMTAVTETMADYIKQQRVAGDATVRSAADIDRLGKGAQRYLEEQDALTKLTGMARQEQEKAREAVRSQERFAAQLESLKQQGKYKEAKALEDTYLVLMSQNKEAAQGFADIQTGNVQTEAAQKSLMGTQGESMRVAQEIIAGQIGAAEGAQRIARAHGETATRLGTTMGMIGTYNQTYGDLAADLRLRGLAEQDIVKILADIEKDREKLADKEGKGADKMLTDQARLRQTQIRANEAVERFVNEKGLPAATKAAQAFASAVANGTEKLNDLFGEPREERPTASQGRYGRLPGAPAAAPAAAKPPAPAPAPAAAKPPAPAPAAAPASSTTVPSVTVRLKDGSTRTVRTASMVESFYRLGKITAEERDRALKELGAKPSTSVSAAPAAAPRPPAPVSVGPRPDVAMPGGAAGVAPSGGAISPDRAPSGRLPSTKPEGPGRPPAPPPVPVAPGAVLRKRKVDENMQALADTLRAGGMDEKMVRATLANVMKETGGAPKSENLKGYAKTSNERIREIFPSSTKNLSDQELNRIKANEQDFAELIYGAGSKQGKGMGNTEPGDGWKYRGRGYVQLTGKNNYAAASRDIYGDDRLVKDPDLVDDPTVAAEVTKWFMQKNQPRMAKKMGIDTASMTQEQATLLATSAIAGQAVTPGKGYLGGENLSKVQNYVQTMPKYARGGITSGPSIAGEAGPEAVVPLPDGRAIPVTIKLRDAVSAPRGVYGENEYIGPNLGPISTDMEALKQIAGKLGAYDAATETITDPATWKEILKSGMLMNYDMAGATFGTKMFGPEMGAELGAAVKEVMASSDSDVVSALQQVKDQFREAMTMVVDALKDKDYETQQQMLETLQNIARSQDRTADASQKLAQTAVN